MIEDYNDIIRCQIGHVKASVVADNYFPVIGETSTFEATTKWGQSSEWKTDDGSGSGQPETSQGNLTLQRDSKQVTLAGAGELKETFIAKNKVDSVEVVKTLYAMQAQELPYFDVQATEVVRVGEEFRIDTKPENGYSRACTGVCRIYKENETENPVRTITLSAGSGISELYAIGTFDNASDRGIYDVEVDVTDTDSGDTLSKRINKLITVVPKLCPKPANMSSGYEIAAIYQAHTSYSEGNLIEFQIRLWRNVAGSGLNYAEMVLPYGDTEYSKWNNVDVSSLPPGTTLCLKKDPKETGKYPFRLFIKGNKSSTETNENGTPNFTFANPLVITHDEEDIFEWPWRAYGSMNISDNTRNVVLDGYGYNHTGIHFTLFDEKETSDSGFFLVNGTSDWEMYGCDVDGTGFAGISAKTDPNPNNPWYWRESGWEFKNLHIHHCIFRNTGGEGVYIGYFDSWKLGGKNSDGNNVSYHAHIIRDLRIYRTQFIHTRLDAIQINNAQGVEICYNTIDDCAYGIEANQSSQFSCTMDGKIYNTIVKNAHAGIGVVGPFLDGLEIFNSVLIAARLHGGISQTNWADSTEDVDAIRNRFYSIHNNVFKVKDIATVNGDISFENYTMNDNVFITENKITSLPGPFKGTGNIFIQADQNYEDIDETLKVADSINYNYQPAYNSQVVTAGKNRLTSFDMRGYKMWYNTVNHCGPFLGKYKNVSLKDNSISVVPSEILLGMDGSAVEVEVTSSAPWTVGDGTDTIPWNEGEGNIYLEYDGQSSGKLKISSDQYVGEIQRTQALQLKTIGSGINDTTELTIRQKGSLEPDYVIVDQSYTTDTDVPVISGNVNGLELQWIRQNTHRYTCKHTAEGKMSICRLDDTDSNKFHDGTEASLKGGHGDVFEKLPKFYYKSEETENNIWKIGFARFKPDSAWKEWDGNDLVGVYKAYYDGTRLRSISGVSPTVDTTFATMKDYANALGEGYSLVKWKHHCIMAALYLAMYGDTDCQKQLGNINGNFNSGRSDTLGMSDTVGNGGNGDSLCINFLGIENWFGYVGEFVQNVSVKNKTNLIVTEDDGSTRELGNATGTGAVISKLSLGEYLDMVPIETTNKGYDYGYHDWLQMSGSSGDSIVRGGKHSSDGLQNGMFYLNLTNKEEEESSNSVGSRLAFRGEIEEVEDVEVFKGLMEI